jgi:glycosyltransferase involved in cell wall biosynthesis
MLNIIGDGPYLDNLKNIIHLQYKVISPKIVFYGFKSSYDINNLYQSLDNRIFIFTSLSETFGKTPMEAGSTGIPIFIKKCEVSLSLYQNTKNAYLFEDKNDFIELFNIFCNLNTFEKKIFISNSINNIKKYDQNIIFNDWIEFLIHGLVKKNVEKNNINMFDIFTFHGISKFINCTGSILSD